jgi:hypothetical protein
MSQSGQGKAFAFAFSMVPVGNNGQTRSNSVPSGLRVIRPPCATSGIEFQVPVQSQVKDERQVRPEIHLLFSPVAIKFNFE